MAELIVGQRSCALLSLRYLSSSPLERVCWPLFRAIATVSSLFSLPLDLYLLIYSRLHSQWATKIQLLVTCLRSFSNSPGHSAQRVRFKALCILVPADSSVSSNPFTASHCSSRLSKYVLLFPLLSGLLPTLLSISKFTWLLPTYH